MSKPIKWVDIFDFSNPADVNKAIKALNALNKVYTDLIKTTKQGSDQIKSNNSALVQSLNGVTVATKKLDETNKADQKVIQETNAQVKALNATYKAQVKQISVLEAQIKKLTTEKTQVAKKTQDVNNINKEAIRLEAQIGKLTGKSARETASYKLQVSELRKQRALEAKVAAGRVSLYQKEAAKLNELTKRYFDVALAQGKGSKSARVLQKELTVLRAKLTGVEQAAGRGQRSVGLYGKSMIRTATQIASAFGIVGGVFLIADLIKSTFSLIKETERYNKALKQVTSSNAEYEDQLEFLLDISSRYGINLNKLTSSYTKFFAATKGTNLEGAETQRIFDAVSKSAAVMSLTTEDTEGALKALGQMISKGKVQAEELRGQLGDRLPGAFRIMADALGVTTGELDKMLEQGQLMADEVLPKFATQLEIAFGLDKVNDIDTLAAAQTRLTNSWVLFVKGVEDGNGVISRFIKDTLSVFAATLEAITTTIESDETIASRIINENDINSIEAYNSELEKWGVATTDLNKRLQPLIRDMVIAREALTIYNQAQENGFKTIEDFKSVQDEFINQYGEEKDNLDILNAVYLEYTSRIEDAAKSTEDAEVSLRNLNIQFKLGVISAKEMQAAIDEYDFNKQARDLSNLNDEINDLVNSGGAISDFAEEDARAFKEAEKAAEDYYNSVIEGEERASLIRETSFEAANILGNQLFINGQINRENELVDLQAQKEFELALAEGNADKMAAVEAKFAAKEKAIRIQGAKAAKKQALFNIVLSTAEGITKTIANLGFPAAIPFVIAAGALGAVQAAAVISQPLPAFEKGGLVETDGAIQVTEKGREMFVDKQGRIGMIKGNKEQVVTGMKGSTILPNPITEQIMNKGFDHEKINNEASFKIYQVLQEQRDRSTRMMIQTMQRENDILMESLNKTVNNIPRDIFNVSDGDLKKVSVKGNERRNHWSSKNSMR